MACFERAQRASRVGQDQPMMDNFQAPPSGFDNRRAGIVPYALLVWTDWIGLGVMGLTHRLISPNAAPLRLFQRALQRVLVLFGEIHHLVHLGFSHFVGEDPAHAHALLMDMQHNPRGLFQIH